MGRNGYRKSITPTRPARAGATSWVFAALAIVDVLALAAEGPVELPAEPDGSPECTLVIVQGQSVMVSLVGVLTVYV